MKKPDWKTFLPHKLRYRLFGAFVVLILLPFSVLNVYNYGQIESLVEQKISEQSHEQLVQMYGSLEDQMSIAFKTLIFLEQDSAVRNVLSSPDNRSPLENKSLVEEKFKMINNSFFLYNPSVYFTLLDFYDNVYTSYLPKKALAYGPYREQFRKHLGELTFIKGNTDSNSFPSEELLYRWDAWDTNHVLRELSSSPYLLSLYAYMKDSGGKRYGMARISIDYSYWFQSMLKDSQSNQEYFLITGNGETIARSSEKAVLSPDVTREIALHPAEAYLTDNDSDTLINYVYIESLDWYMVNRIPLAVLFTEISGLKQRYFLTFFGFTAAFVLMAFMISATFTRPLSHLQNQMKEVVRKNLKVRIPEGRSRGEVLELTRTFNTMLDDANQMINRLKAEERQKEAVHFHMLLAQMNPHFLLNTLNTMKWSAIRSGNEEISEMCVSLGKLLEVSLNSQVELVYLKDEIELVQAYLHIQRIRYRDSFEVTCEFDDKLEYALVPKLSLQPLVENAIHHGVGPLEQLGQIRIGIYRQDTGKLMLEVADNGIGMEESRRLQVTRTRPGIGLSNLKERLRLLFKGQSELEVIDTKPGTLVRFSIPFLLSTPYVQKRSD
ncbi:histidine kinase [Paenibacillus polymyxa]|uniref:cache domain-containing sensor histidine kinase n=1 Tax=Paenibacillus polymyxa TaxID=1406 RepID=UPI001BED2A0B|nr:sensor histidine kinase [Paenibacillus polymyxa]MBT2282997.1 histidine kinase [Paenibacillus polymyxa]